MNCERIPSPVLNNHRDNEASDTTASSSPPTLSRYSSNAEQSATNGEKANSTNSNSQSVSIALFLGKNKEGAAYSLVML